MFAMPWPARRRGLVEADAVVRHGTTRRPVRLRDRDLDVARAGVATSVPEALLDDPEHLDLLVRSQPHLRIDLDLDVELAVSGQHLDVATERGVEARRATRRTRARAPRTAPLAAPTSPRA